MKYHENRVWFARSFFYSFFICFSLLPLSFTLFVPILFFIYIVSAAYFLFLLFKGWRYKSAIASGAVLVYVAIYVFWILYSILIDQADFILIHKDSLGFIFYPAYFPLVALLVIGKISQRDWEAFLIAFGVIISVFQILAYIAFYQLFDVLTFETISAANEYLGIIGAAAKYGASAGILRIDSGLAFLLLIPIFIVLRNVLQGKFVFLNSIALVFFNIGIFLDGHRALTLAVISGSLLFIIWFFIKNKEKSKILTSLAGVTLVFVVVLTVAATIYGDDLSLGFDRFTDLSSQSEIGGARMDQIYPLINKISESPIIGSGFGAHASLIRNDERPYMYEMDYLAIFMKLGILGGLLYFGTYFYIMYLSIGSSHIGRQSILYFFSSFSFFLFAGTNGGMGMSLVSTLFHLYLIVGLSIYCVPRNQRAL